MNGEAQRANLNSSPAEIRATLSGLMPELQPFWDRRLKDYAGEIYAVPGYRQPNAIRNDAMQRLSQLVAKVAIRAGYSSAQASDAQKQLWQSPVLQTGPHCHLLVEPDAFYTHLFSLMGLRAHRLRWHFWYGTSTVKFIESARKGPGWLHVGADTLNVFGLPRSRMDAFSVCGIREDRLYFQLTGAAKTGPDSSDVREISCRLPSSGYLSAADAIKAANLCLWDEIGSSDNKLLQLDDFDVADLIADHLEDTSSWLSAHLCTGTQIGKILIENIADLDAGPWKGWVRTTTDLFFGLLGGKLVPLRLRGSTLVDGTRGAFDIPFDAKTLANALHQRVIVPGLLLTFLVLSILPGTRVLGGCRQTIYYPLMRYVVAMALQRCGFRELYTDVEADCGPGRWGHRVLKPHDGYPLGEILSGDLPEKLRMFGEQRLDQACGDLGSFTHDPLWATLRTSLATGLISSVSPEWRSGP